MGSRLGRVGHAAREVGSLFAFDVFLACAFAVATVGLGLRRQAGFGPGGRLARRVVGAVAVFLSVGAGCSGGTPSGLPAASAAPPQASASIPATSAIFAMVFIVPPWVSGQPLRQYPGQLQSGVPTTEAGSCQGSLRPDLQVGWSAWTNDRSRRRFVREASEGVRGGAAWPRSYRRHRGRLREAVRGAPYVRKRSGRSRPRAASVRSGIWTPPEGHCGRADPSPSSRPPACLHGRRPEPPRPGRPAARGRRRSCLSGLRSSCPADPSLGDGAAAPVALCAEREPSPVKGRWINPLRSAAEVPIAAATTTAAADLTSAEPATALPAPAPAVPAIPLPPPAADAPAPLALPPSMPCNSPAEATRDRGESAARSS